MFAKAKSVARPAASPAAKGKSNSKPVETLQGLEEVCALEACMKALKGLIEFKKDDLKARGRDRLMEIGLQRKSKPDSLALAEGDNATANLSISKRSVSSPLSAEELEILAEAVGDAERDEDGNVVRVPGFTEVLEKQPAMLAVNPAYASDEELLKKIDKALSGIKGIPEDFILAIQPESKAIVSETATNEVFRLQAKSAAQVFQMIGSVALKAVFKDIGAAWDIVRPLVAPDATEAKATVNKMLKASLKEKAV
jgi:hypothetical protein